VTLIRQSSNTGQLYGSVAVRDLAEALEAEGHKLTRSQIVLAKPIKAIGVYEVKVQLHPEVPVTVKVNVARSPEEAEMQSQGVDVMSAMFEKDESGFVEAYDPNAEPGATADSPGRTGRGRRRDRRGLSLSRDLSKRAVPGNRGGLSHYGRLGKRKGRAEYRAPFFQPRWFRGAYGHDTQAVITAASG
jgi:hypothetical protein